MARKSMTRKNMTRKHKSSKKGLIRRGLSSLGKTSRKVIPGVKHGIENVGANVSGTVQKSIPAAQSGLKSFFSMFKFGSKTRKHKKSKKQ
jgi:hypothetical protein